jgi:uncharacterized protein with von Willebrand factor type A (vWA) domain
MKEIIKTLMTKVKDLEYIEMLQEEIKTVAKNAASLDTCSIDLYMELRNNSKIEEEIEETETEIIDLTGEDGEAPKSIQEIFEGAMKHLQSKEDKQKAYNNNIHTFETDINQTMCLKILDVIAKELEKEKQQITKSIRSKISLF